MRCAREIVDLAALLTAVAAALGCETTHPGAKHVPAADKATQVVAARLEQVHGDVRWQAAASGAWQPAPVRQALQPDDGVQTMEGARATVRFVADNARLTLGPLTTLRIPRQAPTVTRVEHVTGQLVAHLRRTNERHRMEVQLPPGTLVLDETAGDGASKELTAQVDVQDEQTRISMIEGGGRLERRSGKPIKLQEAHYVKLDAHGSLLDSGRVGPTVQPVAPKDGTTLQTRGPVEFQWTPLDDPVQSYQLTVQPDQGAPRAIEVGADRGNATIVLPAGHYMWTVRGVKDGDALPAAAPRSLEVRIDRIPPELTLDSPSPGVDVSTPTVRVAGRTEPGASVDVNGEPVHVGADGRFAVDEPVAKGLSNVVVRARDPAGNEHAVSRAVVRE